MKEKERKQKKSSQMSNNPFKDLKGFCVSTPEPFHPAKGIPPARPLAQDEPVAFAEEMARIGVRTLNAGGESAVPRPVAPSVEEPSSVPVGDAELFVAALGRLDTVFNDQFPEADEEVSPAAPRRLKLLARGKLLPEATLDLHGLSREEALERVRHFLDNAAYHGRKTLLIVTGKGLRSEGEPVLRVAVERYLDGEGRARIAEWGRAPRRFGGDGALAVFLKSAEKLQPPSD
ncbi:Smr/MutS family protein [Trichloromonas sp.]|uniref:Smr/MutS family protein n=1 Tax=Trichloromonas sp. TaxID=3069249 RepID=UPI002A481A32|nr:Smr/MutS family protein [Trichloromonas sp.]